MTHKYRIIGNTLEDRIFSGVYPYNSKLPTEEELMQEFNVSRNTIRKAISFLKQQGFVYSVQGSGIFVRDENQLNAINLENYKGLTHNHKKNDIETVVLDFKEMKADAHLASEMNCEIGTNLYFVNRLRIVDGNRWVVEYSYFNRDYVPYLTREIVQTSIYTYIREALKLNVRFIDRMIEARALDPVNAKHLKCNPGDPVLITINKAMFKNGEIFDYSVDYHNFHFARFVKLSSQL